VSLFVKRETRSASVNGSEFHVCGLKLLVSAQLETLNLRFGTHDRENEIQLELEERGLIAETFLA
jgi:hypothetical protein